MIPVRSQWGRSEVVIIYPYIYIHIWLMVIHPKLEIRKLWVHQYINPDFHRLMTIPQNTKKPSNSWHEMHIWGFLRNGEAQVIIRSSKLIIFDGEASPISGQTHIFQYSWLFEAKTGNAGDIRWHAHISSYFMGIRYPLSTVTQVSISIPSVPHIDLLRDLRLAVKELRRHIPGVSLGGFIWRTWDKSTSEGDVQNMG